MSATIRGERSPASVASRLFGFLSVHGPRCVVLREAWNQPAAHIELVLRPDALGSFPSVLREFCQADGLRLVQHVRGRGAAWCSTLAWHDEAGDLQFLRIDSSADHRIEQAAKPGERAAVRSRRAIGDARRIVSQIVHPPGLWVGFLGPDGAGKSTMIERMATRWSPLFQGTKQYHLRPHVGRKTSPGPLGRPPFRGRPRRRVTSAVKLAYWWFDYAIGFAIRILPSLVRSTLVLFDRHYLDLLIDPVRYRYGGPMSLARVVGYGIPRPDVFIVLDATPGILTERKGELSHCEAATQAAAYRRFAGDHEAVHIVDVSGAIDACTVECDRIILDHMESRVSSRLGRSCAREDRAPRRSSTEGSGPS